MCTTCKLAFIHLSSFYLRSVSTSVMEKKHLHELNDQELLNEYKKGIYAAVINAFFIGFLLGIVCYSIWRNTLGILMLIPLIFAYKLVKQKSYNYKEVNALLKERNLK